MCVQVNVHILTGVQYHLNQITIIIKHDFECFISNSINIYFILINILYYIAYSILRKIHVQPNNI